MTQPEQSRQRSQPRFRVGRFRFGLGIGVVALAATVLVPTAVIAATRSLSAGSNTVSCPTTAPVLKNGAITGRSEAITCSKNPTTTTTTHPTTTTTTAPTTTTTAPSGSCPGGKTTTEGYSPTPPSGTLGPFSDPSDINNSNGFNTYVENNGFWQWPGDAQSLCVTSPSKWTDVATMGGAGNGAVQAYPNVQQLYDNSPKTLTSTFNTTQPADNQGQWESAYDLWGTWGDSDIMVWENTSVDRLADNGAGIETHNAMIDGVSYTVMHYPANAPANSDTEHMLVRNTNANSGTENLQDDVNYLKSIGDIPSTGIGQADFGWELCSTGTSSTVAPQTFTLNSYTLTSG